MRKRVVFFLSLLLASFIRPVVISGQEDLWDDLEKILDQQQGGTVIRNEARAVSQTGGKSQGEASVSGQTVEEESMETKETSLFTFADQSYQKPLNEFLPGQTIYLRVEAKGFSGASGQVILSDQQKKELEKISLEEETPFFTALLSAPANLGTYYLEVEIEKEGGVFNAAQNLSVVEETALGKEKLSLETPVEKVAGETAVQKIISENGEKKESFWQGFLNFFKEGIFSHILRIFSIFRT